MNDDAPGEFAEFSAWLVDRGARAEDVAAAARKGVDALFALRDELLYLGPATLTASQLAQRLEVSVDELNEWWRLLRLPHLVDPERRFTESDVVLAWVGRFYMSVMPSHYGADALRALGSGMQQMTTGLRDVWRIAVEPEGREASVAVEYSAIAETLAEDAKKWLPEFLFSLYWRHTAAAVAENPVAIDDYRTAETEITVLFVDLVGFTRLAQRVDGAELTHILSAFERSANEIAHNHGGRLVKLLGDGAMFQFKSSTAAIDAARAFVADHPELPPRRAAIATGRAVSRQGDFFGAVVNLAARLATIAAPNEVVVDEPPPDTRADKMDPVVLKGYDRPITPYRLR